MVATAVDNSSLVTAVMIMAANGMAGNGRWQQSGGGGSGNGGNSSGGRGIGSKRTFIATCERSIAKRAKQWHMPAWTPAEQGQSAEQCVDIAFGDTGAYDSYLW